MINNDDDLAGIHVINKTSNGSTITDANGQFELGVKLNDTIYLSSIQYNIEQLVITKAIFEKESVEILLTEKVNKLEEVVVTNHQLSGNLSKDMQNARISHTLNFYDVGIPGFQGTHKEKIISTLQALNYGIPTYVNIEALYKNISGYYDNLRTRRKWDKENEYIIRIINFYGIQHFKENYLLAEADIYPFVLNCVTSTNIETHFKNNEHNLVLEIFSKKKAEFGK